MATVYISTIGSDSNSYVQAQSPLTPWANPLKADASATANDTASISLGNYLSTSYSGSPDHFSLLKPLIYACETGTKLLSTSASFVARISGSATAGQYTIIGAELDAQLNSAVSFQIGLNDAGNYNFTSTRNKYSRIKSRGIYLVSRRGNFTSTNDVFTGGGVITGSALYAIGSANNDLGAVASATFTASITGPNISFSAPIDSVVCSGITLSASASRLSAVNINIVGPGSISVIANSASTARGIDVQGSDNANIEKISINLISSNTGAESSGIYLSGRSFTATSNNNTVKNCKVQFLAPAGHGIQLGGSVGTNNMSGGEISGCNVSGKYYSSSSPHLITLGEGTTGIAIGNYASDGYIGILASKTITARVSSNIIDDAYGAAIYAKGTTAATIDGNTIRLTGKLTQRNLGALSVDVQSGVNTAAATLSNNTVFVGVDCGVGKAISSLVNITVNQNCTYLGNTYIIPDTVSDSEVLFYVGGASGGRSGATGYNITQWLSGTAGSIAPSNGTGTISVSGEKVIKMPINEIIKLMDKENSKIFGNKIIGRNL